MQTLGAAVQLPRRANGGKEPVSPMFAYIMVKKATASYHLLRAEFHEKYPTVQDVPEDQRSYLAYLQRVNQGMFTGQNLWVGELWKDRLVSQQDLPV